MCPRYSPLSRSDPASQEGPSLSRAFWWRRNVVPSPGCRLVAAQGAIQPTTSMASSRNSLKMAKVAVANLDSLRADLETVGVLRYQFRRIRLTGTSRLGSMFHVKPSRPGTFSGQVAVHSWPYICCGCGCGRDHGRACVLPRFSFGENAIDCRNEGESPIAMFHVKHKFDVKLETGHRIPGQADQFQHCLAADAAHQHPNSGRPTKIRREWRGGRKLHRYATSITCALAS